MTTVTVEEASANLPDLLRRIADGEEMVITQDGKWMGLLAEPPDPPPTEEEIAAPMVSAKEAVRAIFCELNSRAPVLEDGTRIKDYLDRLEKSQ